MSGINILGTNLFAYCYNNPIMYFDPSGMAAAIVIAWIAFTVAELIAIAALLVVSVSYAFNIGGFRTTVNNAVSWSIKKIVTSTSVILGQYPKLGRWAAGVIADLVKTYVATTAKKYFLELQVNTEI